MLVILGLLVGGVLTGQSLIRAAELRSVTTEYQKYAAAVHTFRDKYFALPGDMPNATSFWGSMTNCGAASPSGTGTQTCNGDGDGQIDAPTVAGYTGENFGVWQHLANAGLVEGSFRGFGDPDSTAGVNVPASRVGAGAKWILTWFGPRFSHPHDFDGNYRNLFAIGGAYNPSLSPPHERLLTPEEAWNIDTKLDDGKPGLGKVRGRKASWQTGCASSDDGNTAEYVLTATQKLCTLLFESGY